ncbi:50S ribosomal protein L21e [Candidatus Woesearchaeota archaeon]|nr:50S ribosomal protein L21e [Candidatus Woesearchaeota archaeon]
MVKRQGGSRRKSRQLLTKGTANAGKISLKKYFKELKQGEKVKLIAEPGVQTGGFHSRYYGQLGVIKNKKGSCYEVEIIDGKKPKQLIIHPVHLTKV